MPDHNKSPRSPGLLSKIKNIFGLNIGTIIFGVLLLYMIFSMIVYLTSDTVESYQVISGLFPEMKHTQGSPYVKSPFIKQILTDLSPIMRERAIRSMPMDLFTGSAALRQQKTAPS